MPSLSALRLLCVLLVLVFGVIGASAQCAAGYVSDLFILYCRLLVLQYMISTAALHLVASAADLLLISLCPPHWQLRRRWHYSTASVVLYCSRELNSRCGTVQE